MRIDLIGQDFANGIFVLYAEIPEQTYYMLAAPSFMPIEIVPSKDLLFEMLTSQAAHQEPWQWEVEKLTPQRWEGISGQVASAWRDHALARLHNLTSEEIDALDFRHLTHTQDEVRSLIRQAVTSIGIEHDDGRLRAVAQRMLRALDGQDGSATSREGSTFMDLLGLVATSESQAFFLEGVG